MSNFIAREITTINGTLKQFGVNAGVRWDGRDTVVSPYSHISHRLQRWDAQPISGVEKAIPELTEALSAARGVETPVVLERAPLALSVPFPNPKPLMWDVSLLRGFPPHTMLLGKSFDYNGERLETISFDRAPHILVAGATDSGKSVLLQNMFVSLGAATPSDDLRIVLVDLKNQDMVPFEIWPHVEVFAGTPSMARKAIQRVLAEKDRRIVERDNPFRLVLWVDELAQLADDSDLVNALGNIASIGRGMGINIVASTQHPTEKGGMGSLMKANFTFRLIGKTAGPLQSRWAAPDANVEAHKLPGRGSFYRIFGTDVRRFQSFLLTERDILAVGKQLPEANSHFELLERSARGMELPIIAPMVDKVAEMAEQIRPLWEQDASLAAMIRKVYGPTANTGGSNRNNVLAAIEHLRATTIATTTNENGVSQAESANSSDNSSSSDPKIIKLHREVA